MTLKDLAVEKFIALDSIKEKVINAATLGTVADFSSSDDKNNDPQNANIWGKERQICAEFLEWLLTDKNAAKYVHFKGIRIKGARIVNENRKLYGFNLRFAEIRHPFFFIKCSIPDGLELLSAKTKTICLSGSYTSHIQGNGLSVDGSLFLHDGFTSEGRISLTGAEIKGQVNCHASRLGNEKKYRKENNREESRMIAVLADGITVREDFLLDNSRVYGEINLMCANIGAQLFCSGGIFENRNGNTFCADGAKIRGAVFFKEKFKSIGTIRLVGAEIGSQLICENGIFENGGGCAISAAHIKIGDRLFLNEDCFVDGQLRFFNAEINGDVVCTGGKFLAPGKMKGDTSPVFSLFFKGAKINGDVKLDGSFLAAGGVILDSAEVEGDICCKGGTFESFSAINAVSKGTFTWQPERGAGIINLQNFHVFKLENPNNCYDKAKLFINGFEYVKFSDEDDIVDRMIKWITPADKSTFYPQPYEQLMKVLKSAGYTNEIVDVYKAKQLANRKSGKMKWYSKLASWFLEYTTAYGWRPSRALGMGVIIMALGTYIFWGLDYWGGNVLEHKTAGKEHYQRLDYAFYSIDVFLPLVNLHQEEYWLPTVDVWQGQVMRFYFWFHIVAGWVVSTLAAASLTGIIKKE